MSAHPKAASLECLVMVRFLPIDSLDSLPETCQSSLAALQPTFVRPGPDPNLPAGLLQSGRTASHRFFLFRFYEAAVRDLTHPAMSSHSTRRPISASELYEYIGQPPR